MCVSYFPSGSIPERYQQHFSLCLWSQNGEIAGRCIALWQRFLWVRGKRRLNLFHKANLYMWPKVYSENGKRKKLTVIPEFTTWFRMPSVRSHRNIQRIPDERAFPSPKTCAPLWPMVNRQNGRFKKWPTKWMSVSVCCYVCAFTVRRRRSLASH